jgi:tetratricopeptide (TPR) repeat protein
VAHRKGEREQAKAVPSTAPAQTPESPRGRKRLIFRLVLLLLPALVLIVLELILRLIGYGAPTSFFVKSTAGDAHVTNEKFAWQFFARRTTSKPVFSKLPIHKAPNTIRIFVLGESAAMGTPDPAFAFSRILELFLERQYPDKHIEMINAAMRGIDSHVIRKIAQDCARHEPDLFIVYMGNNEVIGLHGPEPGSSRLSQWLPLIRASQTIKSSNLGQLGKNILRKLQKTDTTEKQDMEYFRSKRLRADDPLHEPVYRNFRANLEAICRATKAPVLLSTVPVNLKDFPPLGSLHRAGLTDGDLAKWNVPYQRAIQAPTHEDAITNYLGAARIDDHFAELQFRLAEAFLATGQITNAQKHFGLARDWDALQFRTDSRMNQVIRDVAASTRARLYDAEQYFLPETFRSQTKLFHDHVHPTFRGDFMLASALFPQVVAALEKKALSVTNQLNINDCAAALAYTEWHDAQIESAIADLISRPPYHDQLDYKNRQTAAESLAKQRIAQLGQAELQRALSISLEAIRSRPNDWMLHYNRGSLCQGVGQYPQAVEHLQWVVKMFPDAALLRLNLAQALARAGRVDAAIFELQHAARLDPAEPRIPEMLAQLRRSPPTPAR